MRRAPTTMWEALRLTERNLTSLIGVRFGNGDDTSVMVKAMTEWREAVREALGATEDGCPQVPRGLCKELHPITWKNTVLVGSAGYRCKACRNNRRRAARAEQVAA